MGKSQYKEFKLNENQSYQITSLPPQRLSLPTSPPLAVTRSRSSTFSSSRWSTVKRETTPPCVSNMHRESPTDATVTVQPSITTNVTVVPEVSPVINSGQPHKITFRTAAKNIKQKLFLANVQTCLAVETLYQFSQTLLPMPSEGLEATLLYQVIQE